MRSMTIKADRNQRDFQYPRLLGSFHTTSFFIYERPASGGVLLSLTVTPAFFFLG